MRLINEEKFVSFYKILGLKNGPQDKNKIITNKMVEDRYIDMKGKLAHLLEKAKTEEEKLRIEKISKSIEEAYQMLKTEEGRKKYDELEEVMIQATKSKEKEDKMNKEIPQSIKTNIPNKNLSEEQYEKIRQATKDAAKKMEGLDKIKFTPIYKGDFGKVAPQRNKEDDDGR